MDKNLTAVGKDADPPAADQKSPKGLKGRSPRGLSPNGSLRDSRRKSSVTGPEGLPVRSKGPSVAALAALMTLAACLWFDVELSSALFRSVLVYLGVSLMALLYRVILSHYLSVSQERAQQEFLERMQREAESAMADHREAQAEVARAKTAPAAGSPASPGGKAGPKPQRSPRPQEEVSAEPKSSAVASPADKAVETA